MSDAPTPRDPSAPPRIAVEPNSGRAESLRAAVVEGGGVLADVEDADALVWADAARADLMPGLLARGQQLRWVQLPFAGIENYVHLLDDERTWTCGKGVYAPPVAEHALALALAGLRHVAGYAREQRWSAPVGRNLLGARVTILGGGEITASLLELLAPFGATTTVVRRRSTPMPGADRTVTTADLHDALDGADLVVVALALTPETEGVIGAAELDVLPSHAWIVNVGRGRHIDTDALVAALDAGRIGGAALDVTDPEPLPEGHPLWTHPRAIVTPHIANTPEMGIPLLAARVTENVRRFARGEPLLGLVDVDAGY
ncbi:D-isomer specific 2-hydroxyacid dehydrogenase family protein [Actinomarinicola tropica]|uniref:Hydroxyacid dehydrogenase n=1 Tax=Actinomarinicola tropica TaxID=2789776 RepID=A0A5Q2RPC4_9ACTN|nr:D-isomer specific 2-hydroxyacid dehydrogenase family protein [Actinomarinicola tropica]QGG95957.1 hydroxyacid dehydrogenase [Actinomarinicola tropica]